MDTEVIVNGEEVSLEELKEMKQDPKIKLKEIDTNEYMKLERLHG